jgi:hypothetical protein
LEEGERLEDFEMRESLFRGKRADNGEWIEGFLVKKFDKWYIYDFDFLPYSSEITPETVGQYTGLTDKKGKKMFEGDIIKDRFDDIGQIEYKPKYVAFIIQGWETGFAFWVKKDIEVIGNIHDNPELLK